VSAPVDATGLHRALLARRSHSIRRLTPALRPLPPRGLPPFPLDLGELSLRGSERGSHRCSASSRTHSTRSPCATTSRCAARGTPQRHVRAPPSRATPSP